MILQQKGMIELVSCWMKSLIVVVASSILFLHLFSFLSLEEEWETTPWNQRERDEKRAEQVRTTPWTRKSLSLGFAVESLKLLASMITSRSSSAWSWKIEARESVWKIRARTEHQAREWIPKYTWSFSPKKKRRRRDTGEDCFLSFFLQEK